MAYDDDDVEDDGNDGYDDDDGVENDVDDPAPNERGTAAGANADVLCAARMVAASGSSGNFMSWRYLLSYCWTY